MTRTSTGLTKEQKEIIMLNMDKAPIDLLEKVNAPLVKIRNYQWHCKRKSTEENFNCCPITGYKKSY